MSGTIYDELSRWYDFFSVSEEPYILQAVERLELRSGEKVLDLGCGTGKALGAIRSQVGSTGVVVGLDLSGGMLRRAAGRIRVRVEGESAVLCQGNARFLPYPEQYFDAILMTFTLELLPPGPMAEVLAECRRVLRPQGRISAAALFETDFPGWMEKLYTWFHRRYPRLVDCRPIRTGEIFNHNGFVLREETRHLLWGLPVSIAVAVRREK